MKEGTVPKAQGEQFIKELVQKLLERNLAAMRTARINLTAAAISVWIALMMLLAA